VANHPDSSLIQQSDHREGNRHSGAGTASLPHVEGRLRSWTKDVWQGSPVTYYEGPIDELKRKVPAFARQTYSANDSGEQRCTNARYDSIIRLPLAESEHPIPIGVVSKNYTLFQHRDLIDITLESIRAAGIDEGEVRAEIGLTDFGERMVLRLHFPRSFDFDPGDGNLIGLRLQCFNSVNGTYRLITMLGWIRFVCSNGMVLGTIKFNLRKTHNVYLERQNVSLPLASGLKAIEGEKQHFRRWYRMKVDLRRVISWIDREVCSVWGVKAAVRALHIIRTGRDAVLVRPNEKKLPSERTVEAAQAVPGAHAPVQNLFHVSQVLYWLASQRRELEERLEWEGQAHDLLGKLQLPAKGLRSATILNS
jgi:uncharacterized protein DUF932